MAEISLKIDGRDVVVPEGTMIIEAADSAGIHIPRFCYHRHLLPIGACRLCLVEIEGQRGLIPSCSTPVAKGMVVMTNTEEVRGVREDVLAQVLSYHPLDCPKCERAGTCLLQEYTYSHALEETPVFEPPGLPGDDYHETPDWGKVIRYDPYKCVKCYRCVRYCDEVQDCRALTVSERGHETRIATLGDGPLNCDYCGGCVTVCPTGALSQWPGRFLKKDWEYEDRAVICPHCGHGCTLLLRILDGRVVKAEPAMEERGTGKRGMGRNEGIICAKGRFGFDSFGGRRITSPLVRTEGGLTETSWEEAFAAATAIFRENLEADPPRRIVGFASGTLSFEDLFAFQDLLRNGLGSPSVFAEGNTASALLNLVSITGGFGGPRGVRMENFDSILVILELWNEDPVMAAEITRAVRSGETGLVLRKGHKDRMKRYADHLAPSLDEALGLLSGRKRAVVIRGEDASREVLEAISSAIGPEGTIYLTGPYAGSLNLGLAGIHPAYLPGFRPSETDLSPVAPEYARVLVSAGFVADRPKGCRGLISTASFAGEAGLSRADVIFPAATHLEKRGSFIGVDGIVEVSPAAVAPPPEAIPDILVWRELTRRLGREPEDIPDPVELIEGAKGGGPAASEFKPLPPADRFGGRFASRSNILTAISSFIDETEEYSPWV